MYSLTAFTLAASALVASAATINVTVGVNGTTPALAFSPPFVNATENDVILFTFANKNHTVTQSTFATPCQPLSNGIDSQFMPVAANASADTPAPTFNFTVTNASAPMWFYCAQTTPFPHCNAGMVFAVNPTAAKNFSAFQSNVNNTASNTTTGNGTSGGAAPTQTGAAIGLGPTGALGAASLLAAVAGLML